MKPLFSFFAESVFVQDDGIFSVLRGGLDKLVAPELPATASHLVLLVRIRFEPGECDKVHQCVVKVFDPEGNQMTPDLTASVIPFVDVKHPEKPNSMTLQFLYDNFTVRFPGFHVFQLFVDGNLICESALESVMEPAR